jgi:hypothetical protein
MAVPVKEGANFNSGAPAPLFQASQRALVATSEQVEYDVSQDGQRFFDPHLRDESRNPADVCGAELGRGVKEEMSLGTGRTEVDSAICNYLWLVRETGHVESGPALVQSQPQKKQG